MDELDLQVREAFNSARPIMAITRTFYPTVLWEDFGYIIMAEQLDIRMYCESTVYKCDIVVHYRDVANQPRQTTVTESGTSYLDAACKCYVASKNARLQGTKDHQKDYMI